ncbi:MAG: helix-turn-helix domain-containing protein [Acidimicrobiales bacterium]|jgi:DNA-binding HxlR family transcriptional regulator
MERKSFAKMDCSVAQCLEVIGEWWSMLIVRDAFLGVTRFEDFQRRLSISRNILRDRLNTLVDNGVFRRVPYSQHPPRDEYKLTQKGRDLWPVLSAMRQWGDQYAAPNGPPIEVVHESCGHSGRAVWSCSWCAAPLGPHNVHAVPGEGRDASMIVART